MGTPWTSPTSRVFALNFPFHVVNDDRRYLVARLEISFSVLKSCQLTNDVFGLLMLGPSKASIPSPSYAGHSTGREYSSLPVLDFDQHISPDLKTLWFWDLSKSKSNNKYSSAGDPIDILEGTELEFSAYSGAGAIPGLGPPNCDLSSSGIAFSGTDSLPEFRTWTSNLYYVPLSTISRDSRCSPLAIKIPATAAGQVSLPSFSSDGKSIAFLRNENPKKISDKVHIFVLESLEGDLEASEVVTCGKDGKGNWTLNAEMVLWSNNKERLYLFAADRGWRGLFEISAVPETPKNIPTALIKDSSVSYACPCSISKSETCLLATTTSYTKSSVFSIIDTSTSEVRIVSQVSDGDKFGLSASQVSEIWYPGAADYNVHAWIVRPSFYEEGQSYPLALFIHGGPVGSWQNSWNTRWNPLIFAEQGYVVVLPDFTGKSPLLSHLISPVN